MWDFFELAFDWIVNFGLVLATVLMGILLICVLCIGQISNLAVENPDALRDFAYGLGRILGMPAD